MISVGSIRIAIDVNTDGCTSCARSFSGFLYSPGYLRSSRPTLAQVNFSVYIKPFIMGALRFPCSSDGSDDPLSEAATPATRSPKSFIFVN